MRSASGTAGDVSSNTGSRCSVGSSNTGSIPVSSRVRARERHGYGASPCECLPQIGGGCVSRWLAVFTDTAADGRRVTRNQMARLPHSDGAFECQFKGKGKFEHVEVSLTNGDLIFKQKGQKQHRTASAVGSSLSFPKKAAKGRAHTFHVELAARDSSKCKKYVFCFATEAELAKWEHCFRAYSAMSHDDVAQALCAAADTEQAASAAEANAVAEATAAAELKAAETQWVVSGDVPGFPSVNVAGDDDVDTVGTKSGKVSDNGTLSPVDNQKLRSESGAHHSAITPGDDVGDALNFLEAFLDEDGQNGRAEAGIISPDLREQGENISVVANAEADAEAICALTPTVGLAPLETEAADTLRMATEEQEAVEQADAAPVVSEAEASVSAVSEWCRANVHAEYVSECVTAVQRAMVETLDDLLFLVPSATALYHLDISAVAAGALWNALAPCSEEQAPQQLEPASGIKTTKTAVGDNVTGQARPKLELERQKYRRTKSAARGNARRKKAQDESQPPRAQDESSTNVSEQPRKPLQAEVAVRSTRQLSGTLSREEREMAKLRLVSTTSTSMRKRQGGLTPPPMPPMTPIRPAASISRLQHLSSPSPIRMAAKLESSPEPVPRTTLSRIERLKAQERLMSPAVPRKSESPEHSALNVRTPPDDTTNG